MGAMKELFTWPGAYHEVIETTLQALKDHTIMPRIWALDHTVWQSEPREVTNRLGWLRSAEIMRAEATELHGFAAALRAEGFTHALLLGMGGSSLAPELFAKVFGPECDGLELAILDTTAPGKVLEFARALDPRRTVFIVATKSGGTVETLSAFKYFYNWALEALGAERVGQHFIAITDPGSGLEQMARAYHFRRIFLNDPNIGGRYSVLSYFGMVPAALVGLDITRLLDQALAMAARCDATVAPSEHPAAWLGAWMGALALQGRDKLTLVLPDVLRPLGDWIEQLVAESTGKAGKGILPVVGEPLLSPEVYGADRAFVDVRFAGEIARLDKVEALIAAGHPVLRVTLRDLYDLGGQFFLWSMATAVAGHVLGVNPFDQPNVEAAKRLARQMVTTYLEQGALPAIEQLPPDSEALSRFVAQAAPGDYIALQAFITPTPETDAALAMLRERLLQRTHCAVTVGYGPRFLHSTGQLHKGDAGRGLFIQFTEDTVEDAPIPDKAGEPAASVSFGVLVRAQALGDYLALQEAQRRVLSINLGRQSVTALRQLAKGL